MEKVTQQLTDGVRSLVSLLEMLREAAFNSGGEVTVGSPTLQDWGVSFAIGKRLYWTGLNFSYPEFLLFRAFGVEKQRALKIGFGSVDVWLPQTQNSYSWRNHLCLGSEEVRFFPQTKSSQIQCIDQFLKGSIQASAPSQERTDAAA